MEAFFELKRQHVKYILDYIERHDFATHGFYYGLKKVNGDWTLRNGSTFYGYIRDKIMIGMVSFSSTRVMTCHFEDDSIYNKLDFLKVIRQYKPGIIKASPEDLKRIQGVLTRVAICDDIDLCSVMHVNKDTFKPSDQSHGMVVDAALIPIRDAVPFLLSVEKAFGRNPLTVNQLKDKVGAIENYIYYIEDSQIKGQAVIEFETRTFAQLGGVFTRPSVRGKGVGKRLTSVLTHRMLGKNLHVNLLVMKDNIAAIKVYEALGYKPVYQMGLMAIREI
ncbi:GNAT family N-acetyltransferase [Fusibacter sp. JL216-2]|uniref:GNAT family N-acetyltransferase n=1 Tax=Fusibacter sp. JL216-2 TaxID=3071453 RepID=UPI003D34FCBA